MSEPATAGGAAPTQAGAYARPAEVEEPLNHYFVHPISRALVELLIPTGVSPNTVSVMGVVAMACACACYALLDWPLGPAIGFVFHIGWHVFDGADGILARRTGKSSPMGEIIDGVCDHVSHIILYVTLGAMLQPSIGAWAWPVVLISGLSRGFQAIAYETVRRNYRRWVYGVSWIRQDVGKAAATGKAGKVGAALASSYLWLSQWLRADDTQIEAAMGRLVEAGDFRTDAARALYRAQERSLVKRASVLSANYETIGVFLSLMAGSPLYFLVFQAVALNLLMASCVASQKRSYARLLPQLEALAGS